MLPLLTEGAYAYIGKLFAADDRRLVRDPKYLSRMFERSDCFRRRFLSLGKIQGSDKLILEKFEGRPVCSLQLLEGILTYDDKIVGLLPPLAKALHHPEFKIRLLLQMHQVWTEKIPRTVKKDEILLMLLHIRTVFGRVVEPLLPDGRPYHSLHLTARYRSFWRCIRTLWNLSS